MIDKNLLELISKAVLEFFPKSKISKYSVMARVINNGVIANVHYDAKREIMYFRTTRSFMGVIENDSVDVRLRILKLRKELLTLPVKKVILQEYKLK